MSAILADPLENLSNILQAMDQRADHFAVLQLGRDAPQEKIRDAYFRLAKVVHPDLPAFLADAKLRADATRAFQAITLAHSVLSDPAKREAYLAGLDTAKQAQLFDAMTAPVPTSSSPSGKLQAVVTAETARIYLARGKNALVRRDWVVAQDALSLACLGLEGTDLRDAQTGLGWATYNNLTNPEFDRLHKPRELWQTVVAAGPKAGGTVQANYYLALWHKQHGEVRDLARYLDTCLQLDPRHIEAQREKMLLERRRGPSVTVAAVKTDAKASDPRRASSSRMPAVTTASQAQKIGLEKKPSLLERLFGSKK